MWWLGSRGRTVEVARGSKTRTATLLLRIPGRSGIKEKEAPAFIKSRPDIQQIIVSVHPIIGNPIMVRGVIGTWKYRVAAAG